MQPTGVARANLTLAPFVACLVVASPGPADDGFSPPPPLTRASARAVRHLKGTLASTLGPRLPAVAFERWVTDTLGTDWSVAWKMGIGNWARERVRAEDPLYVEVIATPSTGTGEIRLGMLVGTFGGLAPPRLDYSAYWRDGALGREGGRMSDLQDLVDVESLVLGRPASGTDAAIGSLRVPRNQLALIARVQDIPASSLGTGLPALPLGRWLRESLASEVGLDWEVSDCDLNASEEVCVRIGAHRGGAWAKVHVLTGTHDSPWSGRPAITNGLAWCGRDSVVFEDLAELIRLFDRPGWDRCR